MRGPVLYSFTMSNLKVQFIKFAGVGIVAFVIDFLVMVFLHEVVGLSEVLSATFSFIVSVVFNYFASMHYVFSHKDDMSRKREFFIFVVLSAIGLALTDLLMWLGTDLLGFDYRLVKVVATAIVTLYNFITRKIFLDAGDK